jgi:hypothetical protein
MRHKNFIVLTGHLDEVALPDLIQTLHAQRKSGRLQVEYTESPGMFFFEEGRLVDARLGDLRGLEALYLALSLPGASFNFNPLIKPPEQTFSQREQRHVLELLEGARAGGAMDIAIQQGGGAVTPLKSVPHAPLSLPAQPDTALALTGMEAEGVLTRLTHVETALAAHSKSFSRERAVYAAVITLLLIIACVPLLLNRASNEAKSTPAPLSTAPPESSGAGATRARGETGQLTGGDAPRQESAALDSEKRAGKATDIAKAKTMAGALKPTKPNAPAASSTEPGAQGTARREQPAGGAHVVQVSMKVEQGRVVEASVNNPRAGMSSYEALALRMARQRRYPDNFNGADTFQLKVRP